MGKSPNPQGKGQVPVLAAMEQSRAAARGAAPKHIDRISGELFTSLFVLQSEFGFQPVVGKPYFLYRKEGRFRLSPLSPEDWGDERISGRFIGECELHDDLTWSLALDQAVANDERFMAWLEEQRRVMDSELAAAENLEEAMPGYSRRYRFHQRILTYGLSRSLRASMHQSGIAELTYDEARGLLAAPDEGKTDDTG